MSDARTVDGRSVIAGGKPQPLAGTTPAPGSKAPDFTLIGTDMQPRSMSDFAGKVLVLATLPSIDTGVCSTEARRFNQIAGSLGDDVEILTISTDLPFAQKRWCGAEGVDKVTMLSDHREVSFGNDYGVLITTTRQLARCVFVVDRSGTITHVDLLPAIAEEPDYDAAIAAVKAAL